MKNKTRSLLDLRSTATAWLVLALCASLCAENVDAAGAETQKPITLVVAPPVFNDALRTWIQFRQRQGREIFLLSLSALDENGNFDQGVQTAPIASPPELKAKILKIARERPIEAILLVGDGAPTNESNFGWRDVAPAARVPARVLTVFGCEETLASDAYYADFDDDGTPDAPIGRIPAKTPDELRDYIAKVVRYEEASPVGNWTRKINVVAGPNGLDMQATTSDPNADGSIKNPLFSGLSSLVDVVVDKMTRRLFSDYLPPEFALSLTQCSPRSAFCPYPPEFKKTFLERANEGALFFVYLGHGNVQSLDSLQTSPTNAYELFEIADVAKWKTPDAAPIALFFACYTGAFDATIPSLAEECALTPNGPVAALAASRLSAPYGLCVLGSALMAAAFDHDDSNEKTLGEIVLKAQRMATTPVKNEKEENELEIDFEDDSTEKKALAASDDLQDDETKRKPGSELARLNKRLEHSLVFAERERRKNGSFRNALDQAAKTFDPTGSRLDDQIKDHVAEFNLLGDPLIRVKTPVRIPIKSSDIAYATRSLQISGEIPNPTRETTVQIEITPADFRSPTRTVARSSAFVESPETRDEFERTYYEANRFVVAKAQTKTKNGKFNAQITMPAEYSGASVVRISACDGERFYVGSNRFVARPFTPAPKTER